MILQLCCIEIIYFDYSIHNVIFGICNRRNDSLQSIAVCMRAHTQLQLGPTGDRYVVCDTSAVCLLHFSCSTGVSSSSLAAYGSSLGSPCSVLSRAISQHYQETRLTHVHMHTHTHTHTPLTATTQPIHPHSPRPAGLSGLFCTRLCKQEFCLKLHQNAQIYGNC